VGPRKNGGEVRRIQYGGWDRGGPRTVEGTHPGGHTQIRRPIRALERHECHCETMFIQNVARCSRSFLPKQIKCPFATNVVCGSSPCSVSTMNGKTLGATGGASTSRAGWRQWRGLAVTCLVNQIQTNGTLFILLGDVWIFTFIISAFFLFLHFVS
jgi:hypothetical protein